MGSMTSKDNSSRRGDSSERNGSLSDNKTRSSPLNTSKKVKPIYNFAVFADQAGRYGLLH